MTVTALRPPVIAEAVERARELVAQGAAVPTGSLAEAEIGPAIGELAALESQVAAWRLALVAEADDRELAAKAAAPGPTPGPRS